MSKKSFFERLTGASRIEEDGHIETEENEKIEIPFASEEIKPEKTSLEKDYFEEKTKPAIEMTATRTKSTSPKINLPKKTSQKPATRTKEPKKKEEWFGETEGQLTIDVYQTDNDIVIKSTIAGVKPEDIDVTITNDMVTIKGKRAKDENVPEEDYYYQELYWGSFSRSVILPIDVLADKAKAVMKNGILTIILPKAEKLTTRKIKVKGEQ